MTVEDAKELLDRLNLKAETGGSAGNYVRTQKPKPGTYVKAGDTIYLQLGWMILQPPSALPSPLRGEREKRESE
jgi:beta-lactam-binding protein with PASTA domain